MQELQQNLPTNDQKWAEEKAHKYLTDILDKWADDSNRLHFYENYLPWIMQRDRWRAILIVMGSKFKF